MWVSTLFPIQFAPVLSLMASELRKLHACVAYSIRMAKRSHAVEASQHLWSALHCLTADRMQRRVLSLSHVLGIPDQVESTAPQSTPPQASEHDRLCEGREMGCQTMCKIYTEEECKGISEQLMPKILEDTMASMQSLVTRLNALEGRQTTCKTTPGSDMRIQKMGLCLLQCMVFQFLLPQPGVQGPPRLTANLPASIVLMTEMSQKRWRLTPLTVTQLRLLRF